MSMFVRGDATRLPFSDKTFSLVFGSPPYMDARLYLESGSNLGVARNCLEWVEWMLGVTAECLRVTKGPVVWVAAGKTEDRNYLPAVEGLIYEWWRRGGHAYRPCYWHRVGIPGSGGDQWFRADVEYVMCFKRPGKLPWADNVAMGHPPKWAPGGEMSHRLTNGARVNQWGGRATSGGQTTKSGKRQKPGRPSHYFHQPDGTLEAQHYSPPALANPGNLIHTLAGGGQLGSTLAHLNEAPFPEELAEFFIRSLCPENGLVLDPFSGSGTTTAVAFKCGRRGVGLDLRMSQCLLGQRRLAESVLDAERPHRPKPKAKPKAERVEPAMTLFGERA